MADDVVYGVNGVREALRRPGAVNRVYVAKESRAGAVKELVAACRADGVRFDVVPQAKLNELTGTREHQGVAAAVSPVQYTTLDACLAGCPPRARLLVLDRVQHPKNLGMLIRTAVGAGASGVLLSQRGGALLDGSVVRSSAGTVFHVPIVCCSKLGRALGALKEAGFWVYGLASDGSESVFSLDWAERSALVVGNETKGIGHTVLNACDETVRIPLAMGLDSLNVTVAAGIGLFQIAARWKGD